MVQSQKICFLFCNLLVSVALFAEVYGSEASLLSAGWQNEVTVAPASNGTNTTVLHTTSPSPSSPPASSSTTASGAVGAVGHSFSEVASDDDYDYDYDDEEPSVGPRAAASVHTGALQSSGSGDYVDEEYDGEYDQSEDEYRDNQDYDEDYYSDDYYYDYDEETTSSEPSENTVPANERGTEFVGGGPSSIEKHDSSAEVSSSAGGGEGVVVDNDYEWSEEEEYEQEQEETPVVANTSVPPIAVDDADQSDTAGDGLETEPLNRGLSFLSRPGILAAMIGGAVVGLFCAILLVMLIVYRMRKKDEGSYVLDEPKRSLTGNGVSRNYNKEFYA